jgi:hypothetical protein
MHKVIVVDWCGRTYSVKLNSIPSVGEDLQVGVGGDKHVRGIVSRVERTVSEYNDYISVHIADDEHALNDDSDYCEVNWWNA